MGVKLRWAECTYCGQLANGVDHVTPVAYAQHHRKSGWDMANTVPCCMECNSVANDKYFETIEEKAVWLADKLARRHQRILQSPAWSEEELETLRGTLRKTVEAKQAEKTAVMNRIRHCLMISRVALSTEEVWKLYKKGKSIVEFLSGVK
jgi:hypothetical protein